MRSYIPFNLKQVTLSLLLISYLPLIHANHSDYYQIKLGSGVFNTSGHTTIAPVISLGKRFEMGDSALEISTSWGNNDQHDGEKLSYFAFPKITYIVFHNPQANAGFFYGGGLSYSSIKKSFNIYSNEENKKFKGIFGEGTIGYEFNRSAKICPALYVDISQPIVAESKYGRQPGPALLLGMSVQF